jgi:hypothetical protein
MLGFWGDGVLAYWTEEISRLSITPTRQYSITPTTLKKGPSGVGLQIFGAEFLG